MKVDESGRKWTKVDEIWWKCVKLDESGRGLGKRSELSSNAVSGQQRWDCALCCGCWAGSWQWLREGRRPGEVLTLTWLPYSQQWQVCDCSGYVPLRSCRWQWQWCKVQLNGRGSWSGAWHWLDYQVIASRSNWVHTTVLRRCRWQLVSVSVSGAMLCEDDWCAWRPPGGALAVSPGERGGCGGDLDQVILLQKPFLLVSLKGGDKLVLKMRLRNLGWHWQGKWVAGVHRQWHLWQRAGRGQQEGRRTEQDIVATQLILSCRPPSSMLLPQSKAGCCSEFSRQTLEHLTKLINQLIRSLDVGCWVDRWVVHGRLVWV